MHHKDHISGCFTVCRYTVMNLVGVDKNGITGVQVNHLSVDTICHFSRLHRDNLNILMEMGNLFPGYIWFDPSIIDIGGKAWIVIVYFL